MRRVPWIVWALLAPAVVIGAVKLATGGAQRVPVVGAGPIAQVREQDAPPGLRYDLEVADREPVAATARRAEHEIRGWPDLLVIALDASRITDDDSAHAACATLDTLAEHAENALAVPVVASFAVKGNAPAKVKDAVRSANSCWRETICAGSRRRLCLDIAPHAADPEALRKALGAAVLDAHARHEQWRASTQERQ